MIYALLEPVQVAESLSTLGMTTGLSTPTAGSRDAFEVQSIDFSELFNDKDPFTMENVEEITNPLVLRFPKDEITFCPTGQGSGANVALSTKIAAQAVQPRRPPKRRADSARREIIRHALLLDARRKEAFLAPPVEFQGHQSGMVIIGHGTSESFRTALKVAHRC